MNWIVENLQNAFETWNQKLVEIWELIEQTPQLFKGGDVWTVITDINGGLKAIGYGLLVLFFAIGIFNSTLNFRDFKRPELALRHFIRFVAAKTAVTYCMDIMTTVFTICGGVVSSMAAKVGGMTAAAVTLPDEVVTAIENTGFLASIPLWIVSLLGSLFITALSFIMIMTVYSRFFRLYMYTALAPLPLASFAGESTAGHGKAFIKNYIGVCMEGAVIVLACLIFSAFAGGTPTITGETAFVQVFGYIAETVFNLLVLVGLVKASDRLAKEILGL